MERHKREGMSCNCEQCGNDLNGWVDMVMLKNELWLSITNKEDLLCNDCIIDRLGRKITVEDFKEGDINGHIPCNMNYAYVNGLEI